MTYRTGSSDAGHQIHHHGWFCADNGILDQILYSGQIHSPFILLSVNQEEMKESHTGRYTFTAPAGSQASNMLHTVILPVITSQILFPYSTLAVLSA